MNARAVLTLMFLYSKSCTSLYIIYHIFYFKFGILCSLVMRVQQQQKSSIMLHVALNKALVN